MVVGFFVFAVYCQKCIVVGLHMGTYKSLDKGAFELFWDRVGCSNFLLILPSGLTWGCKVVTYIITLFLCCLDLLFLITFVL